MTVRQVKQALASVGLSLLTAILSFVILFLVADFIGETIAYIVYGALIALACFFISRHNPRSLWYGPILCNAMGIISAIIEPTFWITSLWIFMCGGWALSLIAAISGAKAGKRSMSDAS